MRILIILLLGICFVQNVVATSPAVLRLKVVGRLAERLIEKSRPSQTPGQSLTVEVDHIVDVSCSGGSDGAIYLIVQGQAPFTFTWSNDAKDQNLINVSAGVYSCTVTDGNNQEVILQNLLVKQPPVLNAGLSFIQHITCINPFGVLTAAVSGGTGPYNYQWSNGDTGPTASPLVAGTYTVVVTDSKGCTATLSASIMQNTIPPTANAGAPVTVLCSNSSIQLQGSGSMGPQFNYLWTAQNGGSFVSGANTLTPTVNHTGTYVLAITNTTNGCTATDATTVNSLYQAPAVSVTGGTLNCAVKSLTLGASFDTLNKVFLWQGPNNFNSTKKQPTVQKDGNYLLSVTDTITGCFTIATATVALDTVQPTATASVSGPISCATPNVHLLAWSNVGNATFNWTGPNNFQATGMQVQTSTPGVYTLTAINPQNGCAASKTITVAGSTTPPTVTASVNGPITCLVSQATLSGTVQPAGMQILWTGPNGFLSNNLTVSVTLPGVYTLQATNTQNGCTATASVTVVVNKTQPDITVSTGTLSCANPTVTLITNTNTPGLTYSWTGPNGFTSNKQNPVVNTAGFYTVLATNPANGCTRSASVSVGSNFAQSVVMTTTSSITCANPIGKPIATSLTPGTTFTWTGPGGFTATGGTPSVTVPGTYTVVATHPSSGCTVSIPVEVFNKTQLPIAVAGDPQYLNCENTPILLSGFGSSSVGGSYSYLWTTWNGNIISGATSLYPRVNAVGTYTIKVTNTQTGCMAFDSVEVNQAPPVTATINQIVHVSCNGTATGTANAVGGGGNGTYSYGWSNGQNTAKATGLSAGTYTVTISDQEGCTATATMQITQPTPLVANTSSTPQTTFGVNNGTATVTYSGGTGPYSVKWSTGQVTAVINNLAPGTYTVTVTDSKGCTAVKTAQVNAVNCALTGSITNTAVSCFGQANGSATANLNGGQTPIQYAWSNNAQTKTINNLAPATYTVTITDGAGCTLVLNTQITSPAALALNFVSQENVPCPNSNSGALTIGVAGGTTPYTYAWSNNKTTATLTGLGSGTYTVTVTDSKGCTKNLSSQITITDKTPPQLILKNATATLNADGVAFVTAAMFDNGSFDAECSIASWTINPTSFNCTQLGARTVTLTATDVNGNSKSGTATVTVADNIAPKLTCPANVVVGACNAAIQFNLPTVTDNCTINPNQIQQTEGLPSGSTFPAGKTIQIFSCSDAAGNSANCSFEVIVSDYPEGTVTPIPATCSGICNGSAVFIPTGTAPDLVRWSNGQTGDLATGLCTGNYTVTLTDAYGCTSAIPFSIVSANTGTFEIFASSDPATCDNSCDGRSNLMIAGTGPFQIFWSNGQTGSTAINLCAGDYTATVTDANGCSQVQPVNIAAIDNIPPKLTCPNNITTAYCAPVVQYSLPLVQDNCTVDMQQLLLLVGLPSGSAFPQGVTTQIFHYADDAGNSAQCSFTVTVLDDADLTLIAEDVNCAGSCDGTATVNTSGGYSPFTIKWSNGQQGKTTTGLCPGSYAVTVTDAAGCSQVRQLTISQPQPLNLAVVQIVHDSGNAGIGSISVDVSGGTQPYTFKWTRNGQNFSSQQDLSNLQAGTYQLLVTDAQGCTIASTVINLNNTVATKEAAWAAGLRLFPNPAIDYVQIELAEPLGQEAELLLFGLDGKLIQHTPVSASDLTIRLDLSIVPTGLWLVQLRAADGSEVVRKLVVRSN